jgi:hypothetical protein
MNKIFISAGHSTNDPGASTIFGGTEAKEMVLTRNAIVKVLQSRQLKFESPPDNLSLMATIIWINSRAQKGDVALELHGNSSDNKEANGTEVYYVKSNNTRKSQGEDLLKAMVAKLPDLKNRGAKPDGASQHPRLAFCRDIKVPSLLIELCFLSNARDMKLLTEQRENFAEGIADFLQAWSSQSKPQLIDPITVARGLPGADRPATSSTTFIDVKMGNKIELKRGIIVNHNSYVPIDLIEEMGIARSSLKNFRQVDRSGVAYFKAVDLEMFGVNVSFDNANKILILEKNGTN